MTSQKKGNAIELTATEFKVLTVLAQRAGRVQSRDHLLRHVREYDASLTRAQWTRTCADCAKNSGMSQRAQLDRRKKVLTLCLPYINLSASVDLTDS